MPPNRTITFERFSDSAGSYIPLDSNNPAVYKQLYRAAKAKLKLRIKATILDASSLEINSPTYPNPLPAQCYLPSKNASTPSLECVASNQSLQTGAQVSPLHQEGGPATTAANSDDGKPSPYGLTQRISTPNLRSKLPYDPCSSPSVAPTAPKSLLDTANPSYSQRSPTLEDYQIQLMMLEQQKKKRLLMARQEEARVAKGSSGSDAHGPEAPVPRSFTAPPEDLIPELASLFVEATMGLVSEPKPSAAGGSYTICCNKCQGTISDAFWHCSTCNGDDYDLCANCIENGFLCEGEDHWLIKRTLKDGKIVNSTTETIAPKKHAKVVSLQSASKATTPPKEEKNVTNQPQDQSMYRTCNSCVEGGS